MASCEWIVTDTGSNLHHAELQIDAGQLGIAGASVSVRTLRGGLRDGVQVVEVITDRLRVVLLPTRGMGIWKAWCDGIEFGWQSPVPGPVHPSFVPVRDPSGLGWLDGFDELLVRCGLESNGFPEFDEQGRLVYPLHGRIGNLPASRVTIESNPDTGAISVVGEVAECRFHFLKVKMVSRTTVTAGGSAIAVHDTVENLSASPAECQMIYHANFGPPLLEAGATFEAPVDTLVPINEHTAAGISQWQTYPAPTPGFKEHVFLMKLRGDTQGNTRVLLRNAAATRGVDMACNTGQLPVFTLWKNPTALADGYVTGLEPGTNFPNPRSFEGSQGRVGKMAGLGDTCVFEVTLDLLTDAAAVGRSQQAVAALAGGSDPRIFDAPQPGWCSGV